MFHVISDEAYTRMRDNENRVVALQDRIGGLESQVELLKEQLTASRAAETASYQKLCNVLSQSLYKVKMFPEVDGLPESQIQEQDMRPLANQHSYLNALQQGRRQETQDWKAYWDKVNVRLEMIRKQNEEKLAAQFHNPEPKQREDKTLDEMAQESFAR